MFGAEKLVGELGDKMTPDEKGKVNSKIDALKKAIESNDVSSMKSLKDDLNKTMQEFGTRLYQNAGTPNAGTGAGAGNADAGHAQSNDGETVDAEFSDKN